MKKIITSVIALLVMGSVSFAQDAGKPTPKKAKMSEAAAGKKEATSGKKTESKMNAAKSEPKMNAAGEKPKTEKKKSTKTEPKAK